MTRLVRWQTLLAALGILIVVGLLAHLSFTHETAIVPVRGGTYTEGMVGNPQYLNPLLATSDVDRSIVSLLFEGLSSLRADGTVFSGLAQEWAVSVDGTVYTCTLRSDVRWHDGEPLRAEDVLLTLELVRSPDLPDPNHLAELWSRVRAEAVDNRRVRFVLERPYAPFLSHTSLPILPAHLLRDISPSELSTSAFNLSPVGSGPFRFVRLAEGPDGILTLDLAANTDYYDQARVPYLEGIRFRFYPTEAALVAALQQGEVDGAFGLSPAGLAQVAGQSDLMAYRTYLQAYTILFLNTRSPILADRRVRQAIALGLDQEELLAELGAEVFPAKGPISPISWAYKADLPTPQHDPERAIGLLEAAGWFDLNHDGVRERDIRQLELTLLTWDVPPERLRLARRIEQQLALLGIIVQVDVRSDAEQFRERVMRREYDLLLYGWRQLGRDPDEFALWHSSQIGPEGSNLSVFQNQDADRLLERGRRVLDQEQRTQAYWEFQELFLREVPAIPLYYPVYTYVVHSRIQGIALEPLNDLGDRFRSVSNWYMRTQKIIQEHSQPASTYGGGR